MCWQGTARAHVLDAEHQVHGCAHEGGTGEAVNLPCGCNMLALLFLSSRTLLWQCMPAALQGRHRPVATLPMATSR